MISSLSVRGTILETFYGRSILDGYLDRLRFFCRYLNFAFINLHLNKSYRDDPIEAWIAFSDF
jgi:hypothetical protein